MKDITLKDFLLVILQRVVYGDRTALTQTRDDPSRASGRCKSSHSQTDSGVDEPVRYRRHRNIRIHDDDLAYYSFESQIKRRLPDN